MFVAAAATYLEATLARVQVPHPAMRMGITTAGLYLFAVIVHGIFISEYVM